MLKERTKRKKKMPSKSVSQEDSKKKEFNNSS